MKQTSITLCIPTFNRLTDVRQFLETVTCLENFRDGFELMVVDDASTDGTSEYVQKHHPEVNLITLPENTGPAAARNEAIHRCRTPYIAFFDSDAVPRRDWLDRAIPYLEENTIIAGKVLQPDGRVEWGPRRATFLGGSIPTSPDLANAGSTCNIIIPIGLAKKVGGFREDFFVYFEDTEFCIRARIKGGGKVVYADDLVVIHYHDSLYNPNREKLAWRNKVVGMLDLYPSVLQKILFMTGSFFLLFSRLNRPRAFLGAFSGFVEGSKIWNRTRSSK